LKKKLLATRLYEEEKKKWEAEHANDPSSSDSENEDGGKKKKKKKKAKDPNRPKRPLSGYMFFAKEFREKHEGKKSTASDLAKLTGAAWKELADAGRTKFNDQHEADKARYEEEMKVYNEKNGGPEKKEKKNRAKRKRKTTRRRRAHRRKTKRKTPRTKRAMTKKQTNLALIPMRVVPRRAHPTLHLIMRSKNVQSTSVFVVPFL